MPTRRFICALMVLVLASTACSLNLSDTPAPATQAPGSTDVASTPQTSVPELTLEQLKNAEVEIVGVSGTAAIRKIKLTDGKFQSGSDPTAADYVNVSMGQQVAFGDLNGDGVDDAAIIIGENYGGTGDFVSVAAMLNQSGQPVFAGSAGVDDRPIINSLAIQNSQIRADATIHGPNDPGCCPAQPAMETFRLWGGRLLLTNFTTKTPTGTERIIKIDSPSPGTQISGPFTVNGSVTIAPFENNLAYFVFLEGAPEPVVQSSILVNVTEPGGPGTFQLPLDFSASGIQGNIRIEISDISAANGDYLALATLFVTVK